MSELQQKIQEMINIMIKLNEIENRPAKFARLDFDEWMTCDKPKLERLLDEAYELADPDYPDQQLKLNHELQEAS